MERWHVYLVYLLVLIVTVAPLSVSRTVVDARHTLYFFGRSDHHFRRGTGHASTFPASLVLAATFFDCRK